MKVEQTEGIETTLALLRDTERLRQMRERLQIVVVSRFAWPASPEAWCAVLGGLVPAKPSLLRIWNFKTRWQTYDRDVTSHWERERARGAGGARRGRIAGGVLLTVGVDRDGILQRVLPGKLRRKLERRAFAASALVLGSSEEGTAPPGWPRKHRRGLPRSMRTSETSWRVTARHITAVCCYEDIARDTFRLARERGYNAPACRA